MVERALAVVEHSIRKLSLVLIGNLLIENGNITGFLHILCNRKYHPQRVVVEVRAKLVVAHFGKRLILVIRATVLEHGSRKINKTLSRTLGYLVNKAQQILIGITEAHSSADTALEVGSGARHIERYHALILIPDVDHTVDLLVGRVDRILREQLIPVVLKALEQLVRFFGSIAEVDHLKRLILVDDVFKFLCSAHTVNGVRSYDTVIIATLVKFLINGHFNVTEAKYQLLALAGSKLQLDIMRSDRRPTLRDGVVGLALKYRVGTLKAVVQSEEALTVGIKTLNGNVYGIERKVIATLFVFGLVIDRRSDYLNLARIEVSLEICGIVVSVPQAP